MMAEDRVQRRLRFAGSMAGSSAHRAIVDHIHRRRGGVVLPRRQNPVAIEQGVRQTGMHEKAHVEDKR